MNAVRVAVIGAGGIGGAHLDAYAALPQLCQVAGVADIQAEAAQARAAPFGAPAYADFVEMLDAVKPDAVSICTPPNMHLPVATEAARRGVAILCEKPPARTLAETEALVEICRTHDAPLQFAFCHRFHEPVQQAQELIASGKLGQVVQIYNRFGFRFARAGNSWFTDPETSGGGILIDTLVHSVDIFRALAGEVRRVDAAMGATLPIAVEDSAAMLVTAESGAVGALTCSWVTPVSEAEVRIYGTEGEAVIDYAQPGGLAYRLAGGEEWTRLPFEKPNRFIRQAEAFLTAVQSGRAPHPGAEDGLAVMRVIEAAYASARRS